MNPSTPIETKLFFRYLKVRIPLLHEVTRSADWLRRGFLVAEWARLRLLSPHPALHQIPGFGWAGLAFPQFADVEQGNVVPSLGSE